MSEIDYRFESLRQAIVAQAEPQTYEELMAEKAAQKPLPVSFYEGTDYMSEEQEQGSKA